MAKPGVPLAVIAAGAIALWSAWFNKSITQTIGDLIRGQKPQAGPEQQSAFSQLAAQGGGGTAGGGGVGNIQASGSEKSFFSAVLADLGAPATQANLDSLYAWAKHEEPGFPPQNVGGYAWNPLNIKNAGTGQFEQWGSSSEGAHGTATFMMDNNYVTIISALKSGKGLCGNPAIAGELSAWSGGGYSSVC